MCNNYLSKKLLRKFPKPESIVNVYSNDIFADFYHKTTDKNGFYNDLEFFKNNLDKEELTIEFASGTGRITTPLIEQGYHVLGIEYEKSMIDIMPENTKKNVIHSSIFDVEKNRQIYSKAKNFIIPATSISLFPLNEVEMLFEKLKSINDDFNIIFDIVDIKTLINEIPKKVINKDGIFYYINFSAENYIIYNLYHKNSNTIGYSIKYNHSREVILNMLNKIGYVTNIYDVDNYSMIKAEYKNE